MCEYESLVRFFGSDPAAPGFPNSALKSAYTNIMVGWR
jgi:hypothetical protein